MQTDIPTHRVTADDLTISFMRMTDAWCEERIWSTELWILHDKMTVIKVWTMRVFITLIVMPKPQLV